MLKVLQSHAKNDVRIGDLILESVGQILPARLVSNLHASALTASRHFCPREVVLCKTLNRKPYPEVLDAARRITYDEGRDKASRFNNDWLLHKVVGDWECTKCHHIVSWSKIPVRDCKIGGKCTFTYREVVFFHETGAQGSIDSFVDVKQDTLRMVEIKILNAKDFEELKGPLAEHRVRSQVYLKLVAESSDKNINTHQLHVIYFMRGHGKKDEKGRINPMKEYLVPRDDDAIRMYYKMAAVVTEARKADWQVFPEGICGSLFEKRCHTCPVSKDCFSGKYEATLKWK